jgi:hypothetical protein
VLVGRIDDPASALLGGFAAGAVIGAGQWLVARRQLGDLLAWIAATAFGMGAGLFIGAQVVGYGTSLGELALMGAITGIPLGAAQAFMLRGRVANAWIWASVMPLLWALGWTVTTVAASVSTVSSRCSASSARSPSWRCRGSCWTGCAPPPQPHQCGPGSPPRHRRSHSCHPTTMTAWQVPAGSRRCQAGLIRPSARRAS